jgi:signal transduction histidine kinase
VQFIEVEVQDTGAGISPEARDELFSPFLSAKSEGIGIGLSISRNIIETHGGKIQAEEREQGGTPLLLHPAARRRNRTDPPVIFTSRSLSAALRTARKTWRINKLR